MHSFSLALLATSIIGVFAASTPDDAHLPIAEKIKLDQVGGSPPTHNGWKYILSRSSSLKKMPEDGVRNISEIPEMSDKIQAKNYVGLVTNYTTLFKEYAALLSVVNHTDKIQYKQPIGLQHGKRVGLQYGKRDGLGGSSISSTESLVNDYTWLVKGYGQLVETYAQLLNSTNIIYRYLLKHPTKDDIVYEADLDRFWEFDEEYEVVDDTSRPDINGQNFKIYFENYKAFKARSDKARQSLSRYSHPDENNREGGRPSSNMRRHMYFRKPEENTLPRAEKILKAHRARYEEAKKLLDNYLESEEQKKRQEEAKKGNLGEEGKEDQAKPEKEQKTEKLEAKVEKRGWGEEARKEAETHLKHKQIIWKNLAEIREAKNKRKIGFIKKHWEKYLAEVERNKIEAKKQWEEKKKKMQEENRIEDKKKQENERVEGEDKEKKRREMKELKKKMQEENIIEDKKKQEKDKIEKKKKEKEKKEKKKEEKKEEEKKKKEKKKQEDKYKDEKDIEESKEKKETKKLKQEEQ
ncbi:hypothetical protein G7046_g1109 [Stylonectria norvegica]|nr:hypothetical protein G7046_g1109 [Stylonectria norvegica]